MKLAQADLGFLAIGVVGDEAAAGILAAGHKGRLGGNYQVLDPVEGLRCAWHRRRLFAGDDLPAGRDTRLVVDRDMARCNLERNTVLVLLDAPLALPRAQGWFRGGDDHFGSSIADLESGRHIEKDLALF